MYVEIVSIRIIKIKTCPICPIIMCYNSSVNSYTYPGH